MAQWEEVSNAKNECRHELVLTGGHVSKRIEEHGLDESIFELSSLNFLEISRTSLHSLSPKISKLHCLTQLSLRGNKLNELPIEVGKLVKLKYLDVSENQLSSLSPEIFGNLDVLQYLNLGINQLEEFPSIVSLKELHQLMIPRNKLKALPAGLEKLGKLQEVDASFNQITSLPTTLWSELASLKMLNLEGNKLTEIPISLSLCSKLRDLNLKNNQFKDSRLRKVTQDSKTNAVFNYLKKLAPPDSKPGKRGKRKSQSRGDSMCSNGESSSMSPEPSLPMIRVVNSDQDKQIVSELGQDSVRPYIVVCVVRSISLNQVLPEKGNAMKAFIKHQEQLHRTLGQNRKVATIATHDHSKIRYPLLYTARPPGSIQIQMLNSNKSEYAIQLYNRLWLEADEERKRKKRKDISGVYQYLTLLDVSKDVFPALIDKLEVCISLPPLTNCNMTKITPETDNILLEVTGIQFDTCKQIMDELIIWLAESGVSTLASGELEVEPIKVLDTHSQLKVVYPSRTDLQSTKVSVKRP